MSDNTPHHTQIPLDCKLTLACIQGGPTEDDMHDEYLRHHTENSARLGSHPIVNPDSNLTRNADDIVVTGLDTIGNRQSAVGDTIRYATNIFPKCPSSAD